MSDVTTEVREGDCKEVMGDMEDDSIHAITTDPPYGLEFMSRDWDDLGSKANAQVNWHQEWMEKAYDVLKPGGHMLVFGGNRTHHYVMMAAEFAGFEVRDTITWHYGCLSEDTEVLTPDGWKTQDEIAEGDEVVAFDPDGDEFNVEETNEVFRYDHEGQMVRYQSEHTDQLVTPNHRVLHRESGEWKTTYAMNTYGCMELPVIDASGEIRLSGGEDVSDMLLGLGSDDFERSGEQVNLFTQLCERTSGVGATWSDGRARKHATRRTRGCSNTGLYKLRGDYSQTTGQGGWKRLLFGGVLSQLEVGRPGLSTALAGYSPGGRDVGRGQRETPRTNDWRVESVVEGGSDLQERSRQRETGDTRSVSRRVLGDGTGERLRSRTPVEGSEGIGATAYVRGGRSPRRPRQTQQRHREFGVVSKQPDSQTDGGQPRGVSVGTTVARTSRVEYDGVVWCVNVPSSYFVARRNGQMFITGNSGYPKGTNVEKKIDEIKDEDPDVVGSKTFTQGGGNALNMREGEKREVEHEYTEPSSEAAQEWEGWNSTLKPATEYVLVARKPLSEGTVAENILEHGTGALNIDGCRIENDIEEVTYTERTSERNQTDYGEAEQSDIASASPEGRYPANVVFDEQAAEQLDREVGETSSGGGASRDGDKTASTRYAENGGTDFAAEPGQRRGDSGGPSRYFYTSKASKSERTLDGEVENDHPTVKPVDLMEWLVELVTAEGQKVLDPFVGSGTTLLATWNTARNGVGIERESKHAETARERIEANRTNRTVAGSKPTHDHRSALDW